MTKVADISAASKTVLFYRERMSHQGIGKNTWIERLGARMVNQEFLDEISELGRLTELKLEGVSAHDLGPIHRLRELRLLKLQNVSSIKNFEVVLQLPKLKPSTSKTQGIFTLRTFLWVCSIYAGWG